MSDYTTRAIEYKNIKLIESKIVRELHKEKKTVDELSDILAKQIVDEIIEEITHGGKDVRNLADLLYDSKWLISRGLDDLTTRGFLDGTGVTLKDGQPEILLTKTGQEFYQSVWVTPYLNTRFPK